MLDHDGVRPSDSSNAVKKQVNRSVGFVICGVWIVSSNGKRGEGNQKYSQDYDNRAPKFHRKATPWLGKTIRQQKYAVNVEGLKLTETLRAVDTKM